MIQSFRLQIVAILVMCITGVGALSGCSSGGAKPQAAKQLKRSGNEIMVAGQMFDIGTPVVLWTDPGGFDAYRTDRRFGPYEDSSYRATTRAAATQPKLVEIGNPSRVSLRSKVLTPEEIEQVRGGGWPLELLQQKIDQFVIHYDVAGTSANCFKVLHDQRGLSVQFMLDIDGTLYQTCDVKEACSHATKANHRSVGIEIANMGSYGSGEPPIFKRWYEDDANGKPFIKVPESLKKYIRTPNFVGRPARDEMVVGEVQGRQQRQYDYTPEQYAALIKLTAGLCTVLPKINPDYPRDEQGNLISKSLTPTQYDSYQGVMGHYHVQTNKSDPGVAFQWDYVIDNARKRMGKQRKSAAGTIHPDPVSQPTTQPVAAAPAESSIAELGMRLDRILTRLNKGDTHYVARVVDPETGRELYARDIDKPVIPASNGKLAVSAATLDRFGSDHKFKTYFATDGDDLWLIGTGDPAPGDSRLAKEKGGTTTAMFDKWADALKAKGITHVKGNLYYYAGTFDDELVHPSWSKSFLTDWYAAPVSGLNFNDNCIDVTVTPTTADQPATFTVVPPTNNIKVTNGIVTKEGDGTPPAEINREKAADVFTISGSVSKPTELESKPVTDSAAFFADALRTHLTAKGITVAGETKRADKPLGGNEIPAPEKVVAIHETSMTDAIGRINKQSQNLFAEAFSKYLGKQFRADNGITEPGSWKAGSDATHAFLKRLNINDSQIVVADGSGLSRENRVTSRMISDLLAAMSKHKDGETFRKSMGEAGVDGTIGKRMKDLAGRVFAKTGYINGVRSLSGYVKTSEGKWLVFSIIFNGIDGDVKPYETLQDEAVHLLSTWPKLASPAT